MTGVGHVCVAIGAFLIVFGFVAFSFEYAIRQYSPGVLVVLGYVVAIVGAILLSIKKTRAERTGEEAPGAILPKICPKCGKLYSSREIVYCPTCGVKLDQFILPTAEGRGQLQ